MNKLIKGYYVWRLRTFGKKPQGKNALYWTYIALPWIVVGFMLTGIGALFTALSSGDLINPLDIVPLLLTFVIFTGLFVYFCFRVDSKRGYIDVLHQHYIKRREENLHAQIVEEWRGEKQRIATERRS